MMIPSAGLRTLTLRARGPVDPGIAWERYARPELWPTWSPQIAGVESSAERIGPGVTGTVRAIGGLRVGFRIDAVDEIARSWSWRAGVGPVRVRLDHIVRPASGGTETTLRIHLPPALAVLYAPLAQLALHRLVQP